MFVEFGQITWRLFFAKKRHRKINILRLCATQVEKNIKRKSLGLYRILSQKMLLIAKEGKIVSFAFVQIIFGVSHRSKCCNLGYELKVSGGSVEPGLVNLFERWNFLLREKAAVES